MSDGLKAPVLLVARLLLAFLFIMSGYGKITDYAGTAGYMAYMGVPAILLPGAIAVELLGGIAIVVGFQTRLASIAIAIFSVIAGYLFHFVAANGIAAQMADPAVAADAAKLADLGMQQMTQMIMFFKNITIAGGFLALIAAGAGAWSVDAKMGKA